MDENDVLLLELNIISAGVWILFHLEVVCGEAEGAEHHVAELLQAIHHLSLQLLVPGLNLNQGCT